MSFTQTMLEELAAWCWQAPALNAARKAAHAKYFGDADPRVISYWPGTGDLNTRERRLLGYFMFKWRLPSGDSPAELAAVELLEGPQRAEALAAVTASTYVFAAVKSVVGRSSFLDAGGREFEVRSPTWAQQLERAGIVTAHLVPVGNRFWLPGPGWVTFPFDLGAGAVAALTSDDADPVATERLLQHRVSPADQEADRALPEDDSLEAAVRRMAVWARANNQPGLIASAGDWSARVLEHLQDRRFMEFYQYVLDLADSVAGEEVANEIVGLASNIWNNTPQPDRESKTALQLARAGPPESARYRLESGQLTARASPDSE